MQLAETLHLTLGQLQQQVTVEELHLWVAHFGLKQDEQIAAEKKARRRR